MKIVNWDALDASEKIAVLQRPVSARSESLYKETQQIIATVRQHHDQALFDYTARFDRATLTTLQVSDAELANAAQHITAAQLACLKTAVARIEHYHRAHLPKTITVDTQDGIVCQRIPRALDSVGLYVPGGSAPLVSTLMMLAIPAKLAACSNIIVCTPPQPNGAIDPLLLTTAQLCGVDKLFKVGGAQAIAAMAYGTPSIPKTSKIFGPGNSWVTAAKSLVAQDPQGAAIDMPAGPSEVLVIAQSNANAAFIASDLLSQAEHGPDSQVILITDDATLAHQVTQAIMAQCEILSRKTIMQQALTHSVIIVVDEITTAINISNHYAPEHLILALDNPRHYLAQVTHAGSVFLGPWSAETMGDYITGSNHVLPTYGYASSYSGLNVNDFMHYINVQEVDRAGLQRFGPVAMALAEMEGLTAHRHAVAIRLNEEIAYE